MGEPVSPGNILRGSPWRLPGVEMTKTEKYSDVLSADDLRQLQQRSDRPAAIRACVHFGSLLLAATAVVLLSTWSWWLLAPAIFVCGLLIASMHAPMHESIHLTAFRSKRANKVLGWMAGWCMLMPPSFYRDFHAEHHRHTHDPLRDPEISAGGEKFAYWPVYIHEYLIMASGLLLLIARIAGLLLMALGTRGPWWNKLFPFVRAHNRKNAVWEARAYVAVIVAVAVIGYTLLPGLAYLLLALLVGFSALVLYLASEHTGLPTLGTIFERSRTTYTNAIVRYFMWNMPYHAEHHAYPSVPFHALPELHDRVKPACVNTAPGYLRLQAEVISNLRVTPANDAAKSEQCR